MPQTYKSALQCYKSALQCYKSVPQTHKSVLQCYKFTTFRLKQKKIDCLKCLKMQSAVGYLQFFYNRFLYIQKKTYRNPYTFS